MPGLSSTHWSGEADPSLLMLFALVGTGDNGCSTDPPREPDQDLILQGVWRAVTGQAKCKLCHVG